MANLAKISFSAVAFPFSDRHPGILRNSSAGDEKNSKPTRDFTTTYQQILKYAIIMNFLSSLSNGIRAR
ncbi:MAG: hypothetical protein ACNYZG_01600 [Gammaproteobacteria bacterium]